MRRPPPQFSTRATARRTGNQNEYELIHPNWQQECADDLEEVHQMIDGGELDVAVDELRWPLNGCPEAPQRTIAGELTLAEGDTRLARLRISAMPTISA